MIKTIVLDDVLTQATCWPTATFTNVYRNETRPSGELCPTQNDVIGNGSVPVPDEVSSFVAGLSLTSFFFTNNGEREASEGFLT